MRHDSVSAKFGGRAVTFKIDRRDLPSFEAMTGASAFATFRRIVNGDWAVADLSRVLRFAALGEKTIKQLRSQAVGKTLVSGGIAIDGFVDARSPAWVNEALTTQPPAQYAALAVNVLGAALFGVDDEDAMFDDGVPLASG